VLHASPISFRIAEHLFNYFGGKKLGLTQECRGNNLCGWFSNRMFPGMVCSLGKWLKTTMFGNLIPVIVAGVLSQANSCIQARLYMFQLASAWATDQMSRSFPSSRERNICAW
jgi:hypothetical protein